MNKCRYCGLLLNGDIPDDTKDILAVNFCHRFFSIRIGNNGNDIGVVIQDKRDGQIILDKPLKVNYCPMCGRELRKARRVRGI